MAEQLLNLVISTTDPFEPNFGEWLLRQINSHTLCTLEEFGIFFLNFVRQQTEVHLKTAGTPKCVSTPIAKVATPRRDPNESFTPKCLQFQSTPDKRNKFDDSLQLRTTPTPSRNATCPNDTFNQSCHRANTSTPYKSFDKSNRSGNNSNDFNRSSNSGFCLGDFIVTNSRSRKKPQKDTGSSVNVPESSSSDQKNKRVEKPKKRVVPTQISKSPAGAVTSFSSPAFSNENNMVKIFKDADFVDKEKCAITEARRSLKSNILDISRELEEETRQTNMNQTLRESVKRMGMQNTLLEEFNNAAGSTIIDFSKLTHQAILDRFAEVYSCLLDIHITSNVLSDLSYLLCILNADDLSTNVGAFQSLELELQLDEKLNVINRPNNEAYTALRTLTNSIYFALEVLKRQRHLLALLDVRTLRVILNNERINDLAPDLKTFFEKITSEKQQLESTKSTYEASFRISKTFNNVFYQQENDTRSNFPSDKEFGCFKSQRDLFYTIFKAWEVHHLSHTWNFSAELQSKMQMLFNISDHPINMAHLAKLFVSQLLVSSNYSETSHTDIGMELKAHVDLQKFSKLTQRLVEPSISSTDFQFPAKQAFFRDFLLTSSCISFNEQVKIALLAELLQFNSSTFDVINLPSNKNENFSSEYVVRPEILSTMQVLAKFLGLLHSQPFVYSSTSSCSNIDKKQIELRNLVQPSFDLLGLLKMSLVERKLLIAIPWIVQYLAMLDHITLQLDYFRNVLHLLYELYLCLGEGTDILKMRPTSEFILRTCLGWFFEGSNVAESYYAYRRNRTVSLSQLIEMKEISVLVPYSISSDLKLSKSKPMVASDIKTTPNEGVLIIFDETESNANEHIRIPTKQVSAEFDPMLECILNVACPFLAEFRVAIMPAKYSKCVSRSGRYRHVTPKISELNNPSPKTQPHQDNQSKLIEAFLHSQNLSVRRIIEFVIERTTSAVIKDAQIEILLPLKDAANREIQQVESTSMVKAKQEILMIFTEANENAMNRWTTEIPQMIESRVKLALDALLPRETQDVVKKTCSALISEKCQVKINDWRTTNLKGIDFYVKDIDVTVEKIVKSNQLGKHILSTNLEIVVSSPNLSDVLDDLQYWLHATSKRPDLIEVGKIKIFLMDLCKMFANTLPHSFYRIIGSGVINLIQNLIENHCELVTANLISQFITVWTTNGMQKFAHWEHNKIDKIDCIDTKTVAVEEDAPDNQTMSTNLFSSLITISFVRSLRTDESFEKLELLLLKLVEHNVITIDHLNELFVRIFKVEWNEKVLSRISTLLQIVSSSRKIPADDDGRPTLFMEVLADFSRDIDLF